MLGRPEISLRKANKELRERGLELAIQDILERAYRIPWLLGTDYWHVSEELKQKLKTLKYGITAFRTFLHETLPVLQHDAATYGIVPQSIIFSRHKSTQSTAEKLYELVKDAHPARDAIPAETLATAQAIARSVLVLDKPFAHFYRFPETHYLTPDLTDDISARVAHVQNDWQDLQSKRNNEPEEALRKKYDETAAFLNRFTYRSNSTPESYYAVLDHHVDCIQKTPMGWLVEGRAMQYCSPTRIRHEYQKMQDVTPLAELRQNNEFLELIELLRKKCVPPQGPREYHHDAGRMLPAQPSFNNETITKMLEDNGVVQKKIIENARNLAAALPS